VFLLVISGYLTFAKDKTPDEIGRDIAQGYLEAAVGDDNWKETKPYISGEYSYYTDKDTVSYKEYKVSCDKNNHCGWIIVNLDGDDVSIPVMATQGMTNYETLWLKFDGKLKEKKLKNKWTQRKAYYFWPFEQYMSDENGEVENIGIDQSNPSSKELLDEKVKKAKEYKTTEMFKETKKELKEKGLTSFEQSSLFSIFKTYAAVSSPSDTFIPLYSITSNCSSRIPCYKQFLDNYTWWLCNTWCVPNAIAMIYGFYDRKWTFPNLLSWIVAPDNVANSWSNLAVTTMINTIRGYVQTTCWAWQVWSTTAWSAALGIQYAKDKWYLNSTAVAQASSRSVLHQSIKNEISANRPVLVGITWSSGHAIVAWGYSSVSDSKMIRVNYGWGNASTFSGTTYNVWANTSAVDVNIDALNVSNNTTTNTGTITSITKFTISL
jgi:Peptidase_C39 like family